MTYEKVLATNRQASFNYFILDRIEAGVVLLGTEVKSLRLGLCNLKDSYARCEEGEVWIHNCHIGPYPYGNRVNHEPLRPRKLLLHHGQILKLERVTSHGGATLVPLKVYIKGKHIKVELGIAKGKKAYDKRASLREKDLKREADAAMRDRSQSGTQLADLFDARKLRLHGEPVRIAERIEYSWDVGLPTFSVSKNGVLALLHAGGTQSRLWKDRNGLVVGQAGPQAEYVQMRLSPDGRKLAVIQNVQHAMGLV